MRLIERRLRRLIGRDGRMSRESREGTIVDPNVTVVADELAILVVLQIRYTSLLVQK
jgi:hypothetical protein